MLNKIFPVFLILAAAAAGILFDDQILAVVALFSALFLSVLYWWRFKTESAMPEHRRVVQMFVIAAFVWWAGSALFGVRVLLNIQPVLVWAVGTLVCALASFVWHGAGVGLRARAVAHSIICTEFFAILLFAPAHFLVLGGLLSAFFALFGYIASVPDEYDGKRSVSWYYIFAATLAFLLITTIAFRWRL